MEQTMTLGEAEAQLGLLKREFVASQDQGYSAHTNYDAREYCWEDTSGQMVGYIRVSLENGKEVSAHLSIYPGQWEDKPITRFTLTDTGTIQRILTLGHRS